MMAKRILNLSVISNSSIFILLSILHFYWAFGGRIWYEDVLPTSSNGLNRLNPSATAAVIVAFGLLFLTLITVSNLGLFDRYIKRKYFRYAALIIAIIFFVRAIGDFKFVGLFKTINETRFAINDTQIFVPICLLIGVISVMIFALARKSYKVVN
jgi:hypothetical protein